MPPNAPITQPLSVTVFDGTSRQQVSIAPADYIKSGGVGDVYRLKRIGQPNECVKIYKPKVCETICTAPGHPHKCGAKYKQDLVDIKSKLLAMLQRPPKQVTVRIGGHQCVQFTWPTALVEDSRGACIGFVMPEVDFKTTQSLQPYLVPKAAARLLSPEARSLNNRLKLARNIAALMADLHLQGHAFVDFKDQNLRVYPDLAIAAFIDTDGYRIEQSDGTVYPGLVTTPTFNSPESARGERGALSRKHDDFVLALVIFQILNFGIHPFQGIPSTANKSGTFDLDDNIKNQTYPYGARKHALILPSPASVHECWPSKTRAFFDQTFSSTDVAMRVSAVDWVQHLSELSSKEMMKCTRYPTDIEHVHFKGLDCHMCTVLDNAVSPPPVTRAHIPPKLPIPSGGGQSSGKPGTGLPTPLKAGSKPVIWWILAIIALGLVVLFFNSTTSKQDSGAYAPRPESAPAPAPVAEQPTDAAIAAAAAAKSAGDTAQHTSLLGNLRQFGDEQTSELRKFADLGSTAQTPSEFLLQVQRIFQKPSRIWEWEKTEYAKNNTLDLNKGVAFGKAADELADRAGVTPEVLYLQTRAVSLAPTDPALVTNLAFYLLKSDPHTAQLLATLAMHLHAKKAGEFAIDTLEVLAAALIKTQGGKTGSSESMLMATVLLSNELDTRCTRMKRYATRFPGLEVVTARPMAKARNFLIASNKSGEPCAI